MIICRHNSYPHKQCPYWVIVVNVVHIEPVFQKSLNNFVWTLSSVTYFHILTMVHHRISGKKNLNSPPPQNSAFDRFSTFIGQFVSCMHTAFLSLSLGLILCHYLYFFLSVTHPRSLCPSLFLFCSPSLFLSCSPSIFLSCSPSLSYSCSLLLFLTFLCPCTSLISLCLVFFIARGLNLF